MKIYLAGPDIFRTDANTWAESAREICRRYGYEPLLPIDHGETEAEKIFQANIDLIRKAQVVVANLNPFRGAEPDSGTCFEVGYALALGKKVSAYMTHLETVAQRVERLEQRCEPTVRYGDKLTDRDGMLIEDFGLPCNLMLAMAGQIVEGDLEACLQAIRPRASAPV
jgi:nucleoside 2-deoxyribosyltransferase